MLEENYPKSTVSDEVEIKLLIKLVHFNRRLKLLLIFIRAAILFYIIYSGLSFYDWESFAQAATGYIQGVTFAFYFSASLFLINFTLTFFNKKWLWISVIIDATIILFIDRLVTLFIITNSEVRLLFTIVLFGVFFGLIIFVFTLIASKKKGKFYLAPIVTFLTSLGVTAYGFIKIRGFEGMAYGFLGAGIFSIAVLGTIMLPFIISKINDKQLNKRDKGILVISPLILFATIGLVLYTDENYWVIGEGLTPYDNQEKNQPLDSYYRVSTISEGKKQVHISLGEKYIGKEVEVENVKTIGNTEITVKMIDGDESNKIPYIQVGVDQIVEPLKVQTTEGDVIHSQLEKLPN
ncbi:hypothetical protein MUO14_09855 [Halobacillus shinanisalinarum]|uniref:Uncharacterized protein n=1 Tax=Halobacillus shinanisalinarum TaxID=2932258 RepID=A0ABY4H896_9BACI|nr:hypothetical protein [Halobacillus shinanisalinarum]UOQ95197.1 hypothetical protein MUO14_09855 [Halobacillus shinanisalinarum]